MSLGCQVEVIEVKHGCLSIQIFDQISIISPPCCITRGMEGGTNPDSVNLLSWWGDEILHLFSINLLST